MALLTIAKGLEPMEASTMLTAGIILLLLLDWRYQSWSIRLGVILLTLCLLIFAQPGLYRAFRQAMLAPPTERIASTPTRTLLEYESGVYTMKQAFANEIEAVAMERTIAVAVLVWLAASPVLRRRRRPQIPSVATAERDALL
jgi:hypothetical protein